MLKRLALTVDNAKDNIRKASFTCRLITGSYVKDIRRHADSMLPCLMEYLV